MKTGVVEQGGDYFWVVKDNQPTLRADIALLFAEPPWGEELATAGECGRHGDRWEGRTLWTSTALNEYLDSNKSPSAAVNSPVGYSRQYNVFGHRRL